MTRAPMITAIVCSYRRWACLDACLASLIAQTVPEREIIVVDTGGDAEARAAFAWPEAVRVIAADRAGLAHARNLGAAAANGEIVAFIDDDAIAAADWLARIAAAFADDARIGAAGGRVLPIWPQARPDWLHPSQDGFLSIVDLGPSARLLGPGEWLAGANVAFRAAALRAAGGFPEHLGRQPQALLGNEEIAVLHRLRTDGWRIAYDPAVTVEHRVHPERLTQAWMRRRIAWQAISDLLLDDAAPDAEDGAALWSPVARYLERLPPFARGAAGLLREAGDAETFRAQGEALGAFLRLLAQQGKDVAGMLLRPAA